MRRIGLAKAVLVALLPGRLRIWLLRRWGARIGRGCRIGMSLIQARDIVLGDHVQIASFNLLHRLDALHMGQGSRMNGFNWITGAGTGSFYLGHHAAITRLHFLEASGTIVVGDNAILAGRGTHLFTHGISSTVLDDVRPIVIGPWSYIGSSSRFVPGSGVAEGSFVGMGAVVTKRHTEPHVLLAGNPAVVRKQLGAGDAYFSRLYLPHDHHPADYKPDLATLRPVAPPDLGERGP